MNKNCREWPIMQALIKKEHPQAEVDTGFSVRAHGTGFVVMYVVPLHAFEPQARIAFCHLDGMIWDRPCSFPESETKR